MNRYFHNPGELHELVSRLCDEGLDADGQTRLNELLDGDLAAQVWYVEYVDLHASIRHKMDVLDDDDFALLEVQAALNALAPAGDELAHTGDLVPVDVVDEDAPLPLRMPQSAGPPADGHWIVRLLSTPGRRWSAAAAVLLAVFGLWFFQSPAREDVARAPQDPPAVGDPLAGLTDSDFSGPANLTGAVGARWAGAWLEFPEGQLFEAGQRLELIEGLAELTFRGGARVILQGPAVIDIQSDSAARMSVGRVAVATGRGGPEFTIHTKAAELVCGAAEFGADVDVDGSLVTEVYHGNVELRFGSDAAHGATFQLADGQGAEIDAATHRVTPLEQPIDLQFVRYLPQREVLVNLADIVAGGNGVRRAYHHGISVATGQPIDDYTAPVAGDGRYLRTESSEYVDGVFIPNGKLGPVQVDSIGRKFAGFPATAGDCWGGAIMARRPSEEKSLPFIRLEYHGDNYGYVNWLHIASHADELSPGGHGLIGMHSNSGITFDLHALRARYPNKRIVKFRAQVGNLEAKQERFVADAWVIVDGELRYRREKFSREDGPETIDVPLSDRDRFLVLAVTDVEGNTAYDWVAFGDPLIELTATSDLSAATGAPARVGPAAGVPTFLPAPLAAMTQISSRLVGWQLLTWLGNNVERTDLDELISFTLPK